MYNGRFRVMLAHHRGPYKQSAAIAVVLLVALFAFFPPFEFQPYRLQAEAFEFIDMPEDIVIPPPPKAVEPPPRDVTPYRDGEDAPDEVPTPWDHKLKDMSLPPELPLTSSGHVVFDQLPVPEYLAKPVYPQLAREAGIEGTVMLKVRVGLDHRVHEAVILSSDVTQAMEQAAIDAALRCRYRPARQGSIEVEVWVPILITFTLN